jgi:hypothetical protein
MKGPTPQRCQATLRINLAPDVKVILSWLFHCSLQNFAWVVNHFIINCPHACFFYLIMNWEDDPEFYVRNVESDVGPFVCFTWRDLGKPIEISGNQGKILNGQLQNLSLDRYRIKFRHFKGPIYNF